MPRRCSLGCPPKTRGKPHVFPHPDKFPEQHMAWVKIVACNQDDQNFDYTKHRICDRHFTDKDRTRSSRLNALAVPSLFLPSLDRAPITQHDQPVTEGVNVALPECFDDPGVKLEWEDDGTQLHDETADKQQCNKTGTNPSAQNDQLLNALAEEILVPMEETFTWQKPNEVIPIPADDIKVDDNLSMYCDNEDPTSLLQDHHDSSPKGDLIVHDQFWCNVCDAAITGFRYTCVQCSDFDLCCACETNNKHEQHYVLRVPTQRPVAEVQCVLATVRRHLMKTLDPITDADDDAISVKSEVKSEEDSDDDDEEPKNKSINEPSYNSSGLPSPAEHAGSDKDECRIISNVEDTRASESQVGAGHHRTVSTDVPDERDCDSHTVKLEHPPSRPDSNQMIIELAEFLKINKDPLAHAVSTEAGTSNALRTQASSTGHSTKRKMMMIRLPEFLTTQDATPAKKICIRPTSSDQQTLTYNRQHIAQKCFVKLSKLPKAVMKVEQKWSVPTRRSRDEAGNSSDEDNR